MRLYLAGVVAFVAAVVVVSADAAVPPHPVADKVARIIYHHENVLLRREHAKGYVDGVSCTRVTGRMFDCRIRGVSNKGARVCVEYAVSWVPTHPKVYEWYPQTYRPCRTLSKYHGPAA